MQSAPQSPTSTPASRRPSLNAHERWGEEAVGGSGAQGQTSQPTDTPQPRRVLSPSDAETVEGAGSGPFGRMESAISRTATEGGAAAPLGPESTAQPSQGCHARGEGSVTLQHAQLSALSATPDAQRQQDGARLEGMLRRVLAGGLDWLDAGSDGQQPTVTWPQPAPDGKPRAPIISWASPLASAPSPFASAASVPFEELVAGHQTPPGSAEAASPPAAQSHGTPSRPVWDSPSSDVPPGSESPASQEALQQPQQPAANSQTPDEALPQHADCSQQMSDTPPPGRHCDGGAQSPISESTPSPSGEAGHDTAAVQQQKLAAWQTAAGRSHPSLRTNSHNSKSGMASSDSVSSWQCPPGALGSLGPTPTASPQWTPTTSPPGSLPVSPKLATLQEQPGGPFDGGAAAEAADADAPQAGELRGGGRDGASAGADVQPATGGGSSSVGDTAAHCPDSPEVQPPSLQPQLQPPVRRVGPAPQPAGASSAASQDFDQRHADPASACCHDVMPGASPTAASPPPNPFEGAQAAPFPSTAGGSRKEAARSGTCTPPRASSRRDSALDHEQGRKELPPPNPFAGATRGEAPPNPFAAAAAEPAGPAPVGPPNPFAAASASDVPRQALPPDGWPGAVSEAAAPPPLNPFAEDGGWSWPAPPSAARDVPAASGSLAEEGNDATVLLSQARIYNTDRDSMLPHSLIIEALNTGSTELTPVQRRKSGGVPTSSSAGNLLRSASDTSSASESESAGLRWRRQSGGSASAGSSNCGSPPFTSLSTQDLMRGALSPPDNSPVDLSQAVRSQPTLSPIPVVMIAAAGSAAAQPFPVSETANSMAALRSESAGLSAPPVRVRRLPVSPFQGAATTHRLSDPRHTAEGPSPLSTVTWEDSQSEQLAAAMQEECAPSSSRSGDSASTRSVASLLADNSFAEWLGSERSRSSSRFPDSPRNSLTLPMELLSAGPRMSSTDLLRATAARRPLAREGRIASLDRPQQLRSMPPLRTSSAAEVSPAGPLTAAAQAVADAVGDGLVRQSIDEWGQLLLSTGPERLRLLAHAAHRGRGRRGGGRGGAASAGRTAGSPHGSLLSGRGSGSGSGSGSAGGSGPPSSLGEESDGTVSRQRSISSEGAQRSADSLRGNRSPRPPLPQPSLTVITRSTDLPGPQLLSLTAAAGPPVVSASPEVSVPERLAETTASAPCAVGSHTSSPLDAELQPRRSRTDAAMTVFDRLTAEAVAAVSVGTEALRPSTAVAVALPLPAAQASLKAPAGAAVAAVRRSRSEPGSSLTFLLPSGCQLAPEARPAAIAKLSTGHVHAGLHSIVSEPLAQRPATAARSFRFASAPARATGGSSPDGVATSAAHAATAQLQAPSSNLATRLHAGGGDVSGHRDAGNLWAAAPEAAPSALPALAVNVAARAAVIAKAVPAAGGPASPTSVFDRATSTTSTEWSGASGSRRGSAASSVASACRAAVIAASLNAAIDQHGGWRSGAGSRRGSGHPGPLHPGSRASSAVLSDVLSLSELPSGESLEDRTPPWQLSGGLRGGAAPAHGPLLSPRDGHSSGASSSPGTPASARSPAASVLPPVREASGADDDLLGGRTSSDFGGSLDGSRSSSPSQVYTRGPSPMGLPPLPHGLEDAAVLRPQPAQDPWLLTFYTQPALERDFAAWRSARFAQADTQQLLYVLAACAVGLANSLALGVAVALRLLLSAGALLAACGFAHFRPAWYQRHREPVLRGALAACVALTAGGARWEAAAAAAPVPWLQYSLLQGAIMVAMSLAATVRVAVFVPSQLLNCALALTSLAPDATAPLLAWLPLVCSAILFGALAVVTPALFMRRREATMRNEFTAGRRDG